MQRTQQYSHGTSGRTSHSPAKSVRHCGCDGSAFQHGFGPSEKCVQLKACGAIALCAERAPSRPPESPLFPPHTHTPPIPHRQRLAFSSRAAWRIYLYHPARPHPCKLLARAVHRSRAPVWCLCTHACVRTLRCAALVRGRLKSLTPPRAGPKQSGLSSSGGFRDRSVQGSCPCGAHTDLWATFHVGCFCAAESAYCVCSV